MLVKVMRCVKRLISEGEYGRWLWTQPLRRSWQGVELRDLVVQGKAGVKKFVAGASSADAADHPRPSLRQRLALVGGTA